MNYLMFAGSLRKGSLNKKLLQVAENILKAQPNSKIILVDLKDFNIPVYDGDIETAGMPDGVKLLGDLVAQTDGIVIASPEYNSSIAGSLKNTIDWLSRLRPVPLAQKTVLLMGASPGPYGTMRALLVTKAPFELLGCYVHPQTFALSKADEAFDGQGKLKDENAQKRLHGLIQNFVEFTTKLKS